MSGISSTSSSIDTGQRKLTQAILELRNHVSSIRNDQNEGEKRTYLMPVESTAESDADDVLLEPTTAAEDIDSHLMLFDALLNGFEQQLRERGQWHIPSITKSDHDNPPSSSSSLFLDLQDLEEAISYLSTAIDSTMPSETTVPTTPRAFFTGQAWSWDDQWCEFYCIIPSNGHMIYISHCTWDASIQNWWTRRYHGLDPEEASTRLGCWEDWLWDEEDGEWYLPIPQSEGEEEKEIPDRYTASEWKLHEEGQWRYVRGAGRRNVGS
ncbi:hypothetical protein P280DRAFT_202584 [Massarina eburnea CBS 473.64]|uniref:Uncharacterized protein n=1 Tax=Massarina eburnea CBS 473.64 TaxID=1395130 RepID=A0A6A6RIW6_9PLEO|nr:hypothetical protein P280DRAFT_202584 [Massarina eburnea CBS 473.64]